MMLKYFALLVIVLAVVQIGCSSESGGSKASSAEPAKLTISQYSAVTAANSKAATTGQGGITDVNTGYIGFLSASIANAKISNSTSQSVSIDQTKPCSESGSAAVSGSATASSNAGDGSSAKVTASLNNFKAEFDDCVEQDPEEDGTVTITGSWISSGNFNASGSEDSLEMSMSLKANGTVTVVRSQDETTHTIEARNYEMRLPNTEVSEASGLASADAAEGKSFFADKVLYSGEICIDNQCFAAASIMKCITTSDEATIEICKSGE